MTETAHGGDRRTAARHRRHRRSDDPRPGRRALRRRLRRRHAADRRPVHLGERGLRQRPVDAARVPGRDPRPRRHGARRVQLPGAHLGPPDHHAGRRAERARGDEPGRAARRPRPPRARRHADRQRGRLRRPQPGEGRLHRPGRHDDQPARRRQPRRLPGDPGADDVADQGGRRPARRQAARRRALEELLRPRAGVVDVHPPDRADADVDRAALRQQRAGAGGQPGRVPRRLQLRRDDRGRRPPLRGAPGHAAGRRVHQHHRQHRAGVGHRRRRPAGQAAGHARLVPDHAGVGHPPRAVQAQALRRPHGAGRGRDRRRAASPSARPSPATSA